MIFVFLEYTCRVSCVCKFSWIWNIHMSFSRHKTKIQCCKKVLFEAPSLLFSHGPQDLSFINAILHAHTEYKYYMPKKITFVLQQEHHLFNSWAYLLRTDLNIWILTNFSRTREVIFYRFLEEEQRNLTGAEDGNRFLLSL